MIFIRFLYLITYVRIAALIDQWVDYVSASIAPVATILQRHLFGQEESDPKTYSVLLN